MTLTDTIGLIICSGVALGVGFYSTAALLDAAVDLTAAALGRLARHRGRPPR